MIRIFKLSKHYGNKKAVDGISFTIEKGEIVGFLGPNGAGKTTTMNMITGYTAPTSGIIKVDNLDVYEEQMQVKRKIGYLPEHPPLYFDMTVSEYMNFIYELKDAGRKCPDRTAHLRDIAKKVGVDDVAGRLIKNLSKGYRQRVGLAGALIGDPEVLILDEPTVGLDPHQIIEIRNLIKELGKNHTVVLSSHILQEISAICEKIIIINNGHVVAIGTTDELIASISSKNKFMIRIQAEKSDITKIFGGIDGLVYTYIGQKEPMAHDFYIEGSDDFRARLFSQLKSSQPILMLRPEAMTLEDVFIKLTGDMSFLTENGEAGTPKASDSLSGADNISAEKIDETAATEGGVKNESDI